MCVCGCVGVSEREPLLRQAAGLFRFAASSFEGEDPDAARPVLGVIGCPPGARGVATRTAAPSPHSRFRGRPFSRPARASVRSRWGGGVFAQAAYTGVSPLPRPRRPRGGTTRLSCPSGWCRRLVCRCRSSVPGRPLHTHTHRRRRLGRRRAAGRPASSRGTMRRIADAALVSPAPLRRRGGTPTAPPPTSPPEPGTSGLDGTLGLLAPRTPPLPPSPGGPGSWRPLRPGGWVWVPALAPEWSPTPPLGWSRRLIRPTRRDASAPPDAAWPDCRGPRASDGNPSASFGMARPRPVVVCAGPRFALCCGSAPLSGGARGYPAIRSIFSPAAPRRTEPLRALLTGPGRGVPRLGGPRPYLGAGGLRPPSGGRARASVLASGWVPALSARGAPSSSVSSSLCFWLLPTMARSGHGGLGPPFATGVTGGTYAHCRWCSWAAWGCRADGPTRAVSSAHQSDHAGVCLLLSSFAAVVRSNYGLRTDIHRPESAPSMWAAALWERFLLQRESGIRFAEYWRPYGKLHKFWSSEYVETRQNIENAPLLLSSDKMTHVLKFVF